MLGQLKQCLAQFSGGLIASQLCVPLLQFQVKPVVIVIFFIKLNAIIGLFALDAALIFLTKIYHSLVMNDILFIIFI